MHFKSVASASALLTAVAAIETHGGIDFEVVWELGTAPETEPIKTHYETTAAEQAATRLHARIQEQEFDTDCLDVEENQGTTPASLYALKECIAAQDENAFFDLLAEDIEEADAFWEQVIAESTGPRSSWISAQAYVRAYFDGALTAGEFATWMASEEADTGYLPGNPEHYFKFTENLSLITQRSHIFEGWGGVLSSFGSKLVNFTVPEFTPRVFGTEEYPAEWAIDPSFGMLQRAGEKKLSNGVTWGVLHIGVRDISACEGTTGKSGVEVYGAVWYPSWDQSSEENQAEYERFLMDESHQVVSEVVNFGLQAVADCAGGQCVPPALPTGA